MRIALTHPFCWPYVRRGTERNMLHLARYLTAQGHEVVTVSTTFGKNGAEAVVHGQQRLGEPITFPFMSRLRLDVTHTFYWTTRDSLRSLDADIVHSFHYTDALAANRLRRERGFRTVFQMNGVRVPGVSCHSIFPPEGWMWKSAIQEADARISCSRFIRDQVREHYDADTYVMAPLLVDFEEFYPASERASGPPTILAIADFTVRRKGVRVLAESFAQVKSAHPDAVLQLSGNLPPDLAEEVLAPLSKKARQDVHVLGMGRVDDVPRLYRHADITVLPSMWEPSGGVIHESLASGTPVVATRHGGNPEFLNDDVGVMFDPETDGEETRNASGLAEAISAGLALAADPATSAKCRAQAESYSERVIGPRILALYDELAAGPRDA